ncbi:hypothetical protein [Polycladidibacter stylochi]|uniref:hypothetical protein n=1 Tax=Polycladidibacter stylochi TaxID=1807766 RepID=UPI00082CDB18|nr:hypothetical protein [Pseudovibrio stylochi]
MTQTGVFRAPSLARLDLNVPDDLHETLENHMRASGFTIKRRSASTVRFYGKLFIFAAAFYIHMLITNLLLEQGIELGFGVIKQPAIIEEFQILTVYSYNLITNFYAMVISSFSLVSELLQTGLSLLGTLF